MYIDFYHLTSIFLFLSSNSYILQEQLDIAKLLGVSGVKQQTTSVAPAVTGAVSWRREGLKYKKNEVRCAEQQFRFSKM
jgi:hypothetical protein